MYTEVLATPCLETTPFSLVMERTGEKLTIPVAYTGCSFWETTKPVSQWLWATPCRSSRAYNYNPGEVHTVVVCGER